MPEIDEEEAEEMLAEDRHHISETLHINISPIHVADESSQPFGFGGTRIDLNALTRLGYPRRMAATTPNSTRGSRSANQGWRCNGGNQ